MRTALPTLTAVAVAFASIGCAVYPGTARPASMEDLRRQEGWVLLDTVPELKQVSEKGCGAACLAMVLANWGMATPVESLEAECAGPAEEGILAADLRDAARRRGLSAFLLSGTPADLEHELARGRPVVVGLAKPFGEKFTAHFEVVVGLHAGKQRIALMDPGVGLMCDSTAGFEGEWNATKAVMLVMFPPEARVATANRDGPGGGAR